MSHQDLIEVSGRISDIFAHRFVIEMAGGTKILADLGPRGAAAFPLERGAEVVAAGEMKPSELKVARIAAPGSAAIVIEHGPRDDHKGHHAEAPAPDVAISAVREAGLEPLGEPRRKPKHYEVLGRRGRTFVECHVEFDGHIRKEKPVAPQDAKWAADIAAA